MHIQDLNHQLVFSTGASRSNLTAITLLNYFIALVVAGEVKYLADGDFVPLVVTGEVGQDARGAGHDVDVV